MDEDVVYRHTFNVDAAGPVTILHTGEAWVYVDGALIYKPPPAPERLSLRRRALNRLRSMRGWPEGKVFHG